MMQVQEVEIPTNAGPRRVTMIQAGSNDIESADGRALVRYEGSATRGRTSGEDTSLHQSKRRSAWSFMQSGRMSRLGSV